MADRIRTTLLALVLCLTLVEGARADPHQAIRLSVIDGQARMETTGQGTETQTPFPLASVGKMMTAVAVLRFVARGQLDLDHPASDYVDTETRAVVPRLGDITLRDLLTMRSGLIDYYDDAFLDDPAETA
ncbi:MAG: serine hydrolase domain-containing protein, partial [Pseudomonadota bacterium]